MENKKRIAHAIDEKFKITERGSSIRSEVLAGISAFMIAVCALLMNAQIIGENYGNYAGAYLAVAIVVFIGTAVIGFVTNLPLLVSASIPVSTMAVTYLASNTGLTYENVLLVSFISAVIMLLILITPARKVFTEALPDGVKKAFPVGIGLYVVMSAITRTGLVTADGIASTADLETLDAFYFWLAIAGIGLFVIYKAVGRKNALGSTYFILIAAMWVCGIVFFMEYFVGGQTATTLVYQRVNLIVATDGASPYNIVNGITSLKLGSIFKAGRDFSAFTSAGGNLALFLLQSILTFVCFGIYASMANISGAAAAGDIALDEEGEKNVHKALVLVSLLNILAPVLGGTPVAAGQESAVETEDGARTGLASLIAGAGLLIALFSWVFFALTATTTNGVGMWINDTETKLAAYVQDTFLFADLIMAFAGASMLKAIKHVDTAQLEEFVPFVIVSFVTGFTGNIVCAIGTGMAAYVIAKLIGKDRKEIKISSIILTVILMIYLVLTIVKGTGFVTAQTMGFH